MSATKTKLPDIKALTLEVQDALSKGKGAIRDGLASISRIAKELDAAWDALNDERQAVWDAPAPRTEQAAALAQAWCTAARAQVKVRLNDVRGDHVNKPLIDVDSVARTDMRGTPTLLRGRYVGSISNAHTESAETKIERTWHAMLAFGGDDLEQRVTAMLLDGWPDDAPNTMPSAKRSAELKRLDEQIDQVRDAIDQLDAMCAECGVELQ